MTAPGVDTLVPNGAFASLPPALAGDLLGAFTEIVVNYSQGRWEPAELNGGKLCEAAYCVCLGLCRGDMPERAVKPRNFPQACSDLVDRYPEAHRSPRILIPRMLVPLYEVRNNRGVGHAGGEVNPNHMDAMCVLQVAKWVVAELVRYLNDLPVDEASDVVDSLVEREVPLVWKVGGKRRVLDPSLSMKAKTLLLLHGCSGPATEAELLDWTEHSNPSAYRRDVLRKAHKDRLIEYDGDARTALISPLGVEYVEANVLAPRLALGQA